MNTERKALCWLFVIIAIVVLALLLYSTGDAKSINQREWLLEYEQVSGYPAPTLEPTAVYASGYPVPASELTATDKLWLACACFKTNDGFKSDPWRYATKPTSSTLASKIWVSICKKTCQGETP